MATSNEEVIGHVLIENVKWRVTLRHGFICLWTDNSEPTNPRYVLSADIPSEVLYLAAEAARRHADATLNSRDLGTKVELGPDVDFQEVHAKASKASPQKPLDQMIREAKDETDYP